MEDNMNQRILNATKSTRIKVTSTLLLGVLLIGVSACSPGRSPVTAPPSNGQAPEVATEAPAVPAAARDVSSMNACTLFPGTAVAAALNATLVDPNNSGSGSGGPDCTYYLLPAGAGEGQFYNLFLLPAELYQPSLGALENTQPVSGLGDKAAIGTRVGTTLNDLMVLKSGDLMIEVNGNDASLLQKIAGYVLANLP
jgi:hypothetical protein